MKLNNWSIVDRLNPIKIRKTLTENDKFVTDDEWRLFDVELRWIALDFCWSQQWRFVWLINGWNFPRMSEKITRSQGLEVYYFSAFELRLRLFHFLSASESQNICFELRLWLPLLINFLVLLQLPLLIELPNPVRNSLREQSKVFGSQRHRHPLKWPENAFQQKNSTILRSLKANLAYEIRSTLLPQVTDVVFVSTQLNLVQ